MPQQHRREVPDDRLTLQGVGGTAVLAAVLVVQWPARTATDSTIGGPVTPVTAEPRVLKLTAS
jgi:hypothetical protein